MPSPETNSLLPIGSNGLAFPVVLWLTSKRSVFKAMAAPSLSDRPAPRQQRRCHDGRLVPLDYDVLETNLEQDHE